MVREIIVDWVTPSGGGKSSVLYVDEMGTVQNQRLYLSTFLADIGGGIHPTVSYTIRTEGRELDTATGALLGAWSDATPYTDNGSSTGPDPAPDAAQVLIRWSTGSVVAGRFLQGRTFIPGLDVDLIDGGNVSPLAVASWGTAANELLSDGLDLLVWHRPRNGAGGVARIVTGASVWSEMAVLRRRRG